MHRPLRHAAIRGEEGTDKVPSRCRSAACRYNCDRLYTLAADTSLHHRLYPFARGISGRSACEIRKPVVVNVPLAFSFPVSATVDFPHSPIWSGVSDLFAKVSRVAAAVLSAYYIRHTGRKYITSRRGFRIYTRVL